MKVFIGLIAVMLLFSRCDKIESGLNSPEGKYFGIFSRPGIDTSKVLINFSAGSYESANVVQLDTHAICKGEFRQKGATIFFTDKCEGSHHHNDLSSVLDGSYHIDHFDDGTIRIWRSKGELVDEFLLKKSIGGS